MIGAFNDTTCLSPTTWNLNDPLFIIGNGPNYYVRNNALTVLKNAKTGINTANPQSMLHVVRNATSAGPYALNAIATFESNSSSWIHLKHPNSAQAAILSGNEETNVRSGLLFDADSSLLFRTGGNYNRMKLNKSGYLGINTLSPKSLLHVVKAGSSGGPIHSLSFATFESNHSAYMQFSQPTNAETGFLSGSTVTDIRSAVIFGADSSLMFRAGGNYNRMCITKNGSIGTGTIAPQAPLHIRQGNPTGAVLHPASTAILEGLGNSCIQLMTTSNSWAGIFSSDPNFQMKASMLFTADGSIDLRTGGSNFASVMIDESGKMGIGTSAPAALLDVDGQFRLGSDGSSLNRIIQYLIPMDLPAISAGATYTASFNMPNVTLGGTAHVSPSSDLADGIIIAYARNSTDAVLVKFSNITSSSINPTATNFFITVMQ